MKNYQVRQYQPNDFEIWNAFISVSKNATFLFHRDFMEYHSDRFKDYSLMVFDENKLVAVLPANRLEDAVYSHQGLTYGGMVLGNETILFETIEIFKCVLLFLDNDKIARLHLKLIPTIYHKFPSNEIDYLMFLLNAKLERRDSIAILDLENKLPISRIRKRGIVAGNDNNLVVKEVDCFAEFWDEVLIPNLKIKYNVSPVHSLKEMSFLKSKFPNLIKQYNVYHEHKIVAGITVFEKENVVHPQYVSGIESLNSKLGSIDFLYDFLINSVYKEKKYFDFGISNECMGSKLNKSLHYFKESFGARTIIQDFYIVETKNYNLLEKVLI